MEGDFLFGGTVYENTEGNSFRINCRMPVVGGERLFRFRYKLLGFLEGLGYGFSPVSGEFWIVCRYSFLAQLFYWQMVVSP